MNIKLLKRIQRAIVKEPRRFVMEYDIIPDPIAPCGTAACIAGHAVMLTKISRTRKSWKVLGKKLSQTGVSWWDTKKGAMSSLGIDCLQAHRLFHLSGWPDFFRKAYNAAGYADGLTAKERCAKAKVAIARIDHFIATKGAE